MLLSYVNLATYFLVCLYVINHVIRNWCFVSCSHILVACVVYVMDPAFTALCSLIVCVGLRGRITY